MQVAETAGVPAERVTDDPIERLLYARDLAPVPALLTRPFFRTVPDAVVRPGNAQQVADVLRAATREHVPVTPRAAATTSYYNAVPVRGGLVLDVNDLRGVLGLDQERQIVRVLPATSWSDLDDALSPKGFEVKSYPSSALSATVGGWISTQGQGIGSLKYGGVGDQLVGLQVALPDGELRTLDRDTDPPLDWFVAAEGTLGVVTEVELSVRPRPEVEAFHLLAFDDGWDLVHAAASLARRKPRPFTLSFADPGYLRLLVRAGFGTPVDPDSRQPILLVSLQGTQDEVQRGLDALAGQPGHVLPPELALEEWSRRLYHLRAKRAGPSLLAAEQWLPLGAVGGYLAEAEEMGNRDRVQVGSYGVAVSTDWALVMSLYPTDEEKPIQYLAAIGYTKRLHDLGAKFGGHPYGVGLWNLPYLHRIFDRGHLAELRRRKAALDSADIMNPGKLYGAPFPLWPATFNPGAWALGEFYAAMGWRRR